MAAKIVYSATAQLKGATEADNVGVSFESVYRQLPYTELAPVYVPGCILYPSIPAQTISEAVFAFTGNTKGAYLKLLDTENWRLSGNAVQTTAENFTNRFYFEFGNNFTRRLGSDDTITGTPSFAPWKPGAYDYNSLAASSTRLVRSQLASRTPGAATQAVFLDGGNYSVASASVTPNPDRAFQGLDLSGVSVATTNGGAEAGLPVMLISPRHAVCNKHAGAYTGQTVVFRRRDGSYQSVQVLGEIDSVSATGVDDDLRVIVLGADVTDCVYYKTLPSDWQRYIPALSMQTLYTLGAVGCVPLVFRQHNTGVNPPNNPTLSGNNPIASNSPKLRVEWLAAMDGRLSVSGLNVIGRGAALTRFPDDPLYAFFNLAYPGDSGSPGFMLVPQSPNSQSFTPALVSSYWYPAGGPAYPDRRPWIDTAMQQLSTTYGVPGSYTFGTVDLSAYPTYD